MAKGDTKTNQYLDIAANGTRADLPTDTCCETRSQTLIREVAERIIIEEETRAREDQILQSEIDEIKNSPDVADIVPTYAALQDYDTSKLTDQDIIRVLADETHEGASTYYRWSTSSQTFTYVGETGDYYTKDQVDDLLDNKQDLLTAGDGITIEEESGALVISSTGGGGGTSNFNQLTNRPKYNGATMTSSTDIPEVKTYSAGTGLDLTGTTFSADTTVLATKTDLDSKQDELTAGDNVTIEDESGALVISATDTTYSAFTGTDGTAVGTAGLVPAPATTDVGKFLKADGSWDTAGGGGTGIIELTSADYNYPTDNPTQIAAWLLPDGIYHSASTAIQWSAYGDSAVNGTFIKTTNSSNIAFVFFYRESGLNEVILSQALGSTHYTNLSTSAVKQTTGTSTTDVMSQNAATSMVYADPDTQYKIKIGAGASDAEGNNAIEIGHDATATGTNSVAIGYGASTQSFANSVAIGRNAKATMNGEFHIGAGNKTTGYSGTQYRLLTGVYDPQSAHDAATKGYVDTAVAGAAYEPTISNNTLYL